MKKGPFWFVIPVAAIGILFVGLSLTSCSSSMSSLGGLRTEVVQIPKPEAKAVAPEVKREIPYTPDTFKPEIAKEAPPASVPAPAPKKKKKG